ncbi:superoxide dismutase family protein [Salinicoccus sp. ID82-1]|uniref:superoxide dismutase family protein n=1 Tax=Salinicoccus sp. ID82-1 TaxID=2820269 RepID=UPI001F369713|nr:superoxide dismutase family protein [Salinicoccus sp. ID82-1]MCG1009666.1 superoxide dismutase family protein [Salinicoccus sp. ID82-1]
MKLWKMLLLVMAVSVVLAACGDESESDPEVEEGAIDETVDEEDPGGVLDVPEEEVTLINTEGEETATATLSEGDSGVNVAIEGENLPPGELGFHFHETGSCELPDFESAGGHYNPTDANHGFEDPEGPHAGDMENIEVAEDGTVDTETTADMVTMQENEENTLYTEEGTALIIHSEADDYVSQPSGDAGERIACGVVGE